MGLWSLIKSYDYKNKDQRIATYIAILVLGVLFGFYTSWVFRGEYSFAVNLSFLSWGFIIPAGLSVLILYSAYEKTGVVALEFAMGTMTCFIFVIMLQWVFFRFGYYVVGGNDIRQARALCESVSDWVDKNHDYIRFNVQRRFLPTEQEDGTVLFSLGKVQNPELLYSETPRPGTLTEHRVVDVTIWCRFYDPRQPRGSGPYLYNYRLKRWSEPR